MYAQKTENKEKSFGRTVKRNENEQSTIHTHTQTQSEMK